MQIPITYIVFPEIQLHQHYGHKLRGFFGNLFKDKSPLLHNHYDDGKLRYKYPLVQYKVVNSVPMLVGIAEGSELLSELFTKIDLLNLYDIKIRVYEKNIKREIYSPEIYSSMFKRYIFKSLWMALNQKNYAIYKKITFGPKITLMLKKILIGNILSFFKGIGYTATKEIDLLPLVIPKKTKFKNKDMEAFIGDFYTNVALPDFIGLGKSVSRGFGTIIDGDGANARFPRNLE